MSTNGQLVFTDVDKITFKGVGTRATSTDTPVPDDWKTYMQALRDLPANTEDLENPVWPVRPDE